MKVPHRQKLDLLAFNELCGSCPWKWGHALTFQRNIFCPSISQGHLEISTNPPCPKTQLNETSSHHWKPCLASKDASSDSILSITRSSSYGPLNRLQEVSTVPAFHITIVSSFLLPNSSFLCTCSLNPSFHSLTQLWSFSLSSSYLPPVHQQNLFDFPFSEWSINIPLIPLLYLPSLALWTIAWLSFIE